MSYKVYKVGGCVRDQLLGIVPKDIDYVVVGAKPDDLVKLGYKQVGKSFPVFLHPETSDEYALARKELKTGKGYGGFDFDCDNVSLKEDMSRRDLTINAMAIDEKTGEVVDYYNGQEDLNNKILRHVTPSFAEDPLRVLRVARFAARYDGFVVAEDTNELMKEIVLSGELKELTTERVWKEFEKAFSETNPLRFIEVLDDCGALKEILPEIYNMKGVKQRGYYHAEGDVFIHNNMVLEEAVFYSKELDDFDKVMIRMGAFFHDVGKVKTPKFLEKEGKHHGHEDRDVVEPILNDVFEKIKAPNIIKDFCLDVACIHQKIHAIKAYKPKTIIKMYRNFDLERKEKKYSNYFDNLMLACRADATGRLHKHDNGEILKPKMEDYTQEYFARKTFDVFCENYGSQVVKTFRENNNGEMPSVEYIKGEKNRLSHLRMSELVKSLKETKKSKKLKKAP